MDKIKLFIKANPLLHCLASLIYLATIGIRWVLLNGLLQLVLQSYFYLFTGKILVIIYCYFPSHFQNLQRIPELLLGREDIFSVWVFCKFEKDEYPLRLPEQIIVKYGVPYHACGLFASRIFLSPMVGISSCSMPRFSEKIHFLVSLTGIEGVYFDHHFDGWDYIFCAGEHHINDFRRLSKLRKWKKKALIRGGYPKLDDQLRRARLNHISIQKRSVIYAPTHIYEVNRDLASLRRYGEDIVSVLQSTGFNTIFRPHPASFLDREGDAIVVERIRQKHDGKSNFCLDDSKDYFQSYSDSALMITDLSGTGFTFAFAFECPVIFFAPDLDAEAGKIGIQFEDREKIGEVVRDLQSLKKAVNQIFENYEDYTARIVEYRKRLLFNLGRSEEYFAENIPFILTKSIQPDWVYL
jgi:CDP-glycerol glycerophosphotransferase (TagB/SpsB family)